MCIERRDSRRHGGFTLIEVLVVMLICVGIVLLMGGLYKSVGQAALALRVGQQEWGAQRQLKGQLLHLFQPPGLGLTPLRGDERELYAVTWQSRRDGLNGKPVLAYFRYDATRRVLDYAELPLPAWWGEAVSPRDWRAEARAAPAAPLVTGAENLRFLYLPADAVDSLPEHWLSDWNADPPPKLLRLDFTKAGRAYAIWFDLRAQGA